MESITQLRTSSCLYEYTSSEKRAQKKGIGFSRHDEANSTQFLQVLHFSNPRVLPTRLLKPRTSIEPRTFRLKQMFSMRLNALLAFLAAMLWHADCTNEHNQLMHLIYSEHVPASNTTNQDGSTRRRRGQESQNVESIYPLAWRNMDELLVSISTDMDEAESTLKPVLESLGLDITACSRYTCSGFLNINTFPQVEELLEVVAIVPSLRATNTQFGAGSIFNGASTSLGVDALKREFPSFTGAGVKIGILSDSFDNNAVADFRPSAADDIASGNIPDNVVVVKDTEQGGDEGRAMIQLIHDLAPDAQLYFRTAFDGPADFADGIRELADLGCDIIVDDVSKFAAHERTSLLCCGH